MKDNKLALYIHLVWATWDRAAMIEPQFERRLHRTIEAEARKMGCTVLALDGMPDHIHLLVSLPATVAIADLVKQVKGVSSYFVNHELRPEFQFKWQGSYGAFSISSADLHRAISYVQCQKDHHAASELVAEWEQSVKVLDTTGDN